MRRVAVALLSLLFLAGPALAGPDQSGEGEKSEKKEAKKVPLSAMQKVAFGFRRRGDFAPAATAFEDIFTRLKEDSVYRLPIGLELAQLYLAMGKPYRAVGVYRRLKRVRDEVDTLLKTNKPRYHREALVVSRAVKWDEGEARALMKLGKNEEALEVLAKAGKPLASLRGELLLKLQRHREAVKAFEEKSDYYGMARATLLIDKDQARRLFEDAAESEKYRLKHEVLPRVKRVKELFAKQSKDTLTVDRERARAYYAQQLGQIAGIYHRLGLIFEGAKDYENAIKAGTRAVRYRDAQKKTLLDASSPWGEDAFGKQAIEALGIRKATEEAENALSRYRSAKGG